MSNNQYGIAFLTCISIMLILQSILLILAEFIIKQKGAIIKDNRKQHREK